MCLKNYIFVLCVIAIKCHANSFKFVDVAPVSAAPVAPVAPSNCLNDSLTNYNPSRTINFNLPIMDMTLKTNRNVHLLKEVHNQQVFLLHGPELYRMIVSHQEKRLTPIGILSGGVLEKEPLGAEIIICRDHLLILVALNENIEVYQLDIGILEKGAQPVQGSEDAQKPPPHFEPIQQLSLSGHFQQMHITELEPGHIVLIVAVNFTKNHGKLLTFEWTTTYFNPLQELVVPPIHVFEIFGSNPKYLMDGKAVKHQSKTILYIYEIQNHSLVLHQTLTVNSRVVHVATYRNKNILFSCSRREKSCNMFHMKDGQFDVQKKRSTNELSFKKFVAGDNFLVGSLANEVRVYQNSRLNCYASFSLNETDVNAIVIGINQFNESFVFLHFKRPFQTIVSIIEVKVANDTMSATNGTEIHAEDIDILRRHQSLFEDSISRLRNVLLRRKQALDIFHKIDSAYRPKIKNLKVNHGMNVQAGNVGIVQVVNKELYSPVQLMQRIQDIDQLQGEARNKRSTNASRTSNAPIRLKARQLVVENLVYDGDIIEGFHLSDSENGQPTLSISSNISTIYIAALNDIHSDHARMHRQIGLNSNSNLKKIRRLQVDRINNVLWDDFYTSLFLKNRDSTIKGQLILQTESEIANLSTVKLNNIEVDNLFNLKHPQVIHSNVTFSGFLVSNLSAEKVNGLNFAEDIVFNGEDAFIETPVVMYDARIAGDLIIPGFTLDNSPLTALQQKNFKQFYTGSVKLIGSLTVNNLDREQKTSADIFLNEDPISLDSLKQNFLFYNEPQSFKKPVIIGNGKVTAPALNTTFLNNHPVRDYLLNIDQPCSNHTLSLIVLNATVKGDLISENLDSSLLNISRNAVRIGGVANITGVKTFKAPLIIDHLMTLQLNHLNVSELVLKDALISGFRLNGVKFFENILINREATIQDALNAIYLNNLPLHELLNYDYRFERFDVPQSLNVSNIVFQKMNDIGFDKVFTKLNVNDDQLVLHKDLIVEGNAYFRKNLNLKQINGIDWNAYRQDLVMKSENAKIEGCKRFQKELTITKGLITPTIDNQNIKQLFSNVLSRSKPQLITGSYVFDNLQITNLDVSIINNVNTESFIDMRSDEIVIDSDVQIPKLTVLDNVFGDFDNDFDFGTVRARLLKLPEKHCQNIFVLGNAHWKDNSTASKRHVERLKYVYRNAVRKNSDQEISGSVKLIFPRVTNMTTKSPYLNDVNIDFLASDSLLKTSANEQVFVGSNEFTKPLTLQQAEVYGNLETKYLNRIDVSLFDKSLYRRSSRDPLMGTLHFIAEPSIDSLAVEGAINNVNTTQICVQGSDRALPPMMVNNLFIENALQLGKINDMELDFLLDNRVRKHGEALEVFGTLSFENLVLNKEILMNSINGIPINKMVFKKSEKMQAITGPKYIDGKLVLQGPAHVLSLNDLDLIEAYEQSLFKSKNHQFDNLAIDRATFLDGFVLINDIDDAKQEGRLMTDNADSKDISSKSNPFNKTDDPADTDMQDFLYMDYDFETDIVWQPANETVDGTLYHELKAISRCKSQILQVQYSRIQNRLFLSNITTGWIGAQSQNLTVKIENFCKSGKQTTKSRIKVKVDNYSKMFAIKKNIRSVFIHNINSSVELVILHAVDLNSIRNEIRILKVDKVGKDILDWQSMNSGIGQSVKLLDLGFHETALISLAGFGNKSMANIYSFHKDRLKFTLTQSISGAFDIVEVMSFKPHQPTHLILTCRHCKDISIFEYKKPKNQFRMIQILKVTGLIDRLMTFSMSDGSKYLLVLSENEHNFYHLYKYSHIQGWMHFTYGYYPGIQLALPLSGGLLGKSEDNVLLLCSLDNCRLVKTFLRH